MSSGLILPPGVKRVHGRDLWPTRDVLKLKGGGLLKHHGEWIPLGGGNMAKVYRGPHELTVLVSLDDRDGMGPLLHMSMSLPRGYPNWDLVYAVTRSVFGEQVDAMMPIPREEAFIHGFNPKGQREVFHVVEMPRAWPAEGPF